MVRPETEKGIRSCQSNEPSARFTLSFRAHVKSDTVYPHPPSDSSNPTVNVGRSQSDKFEEGQKSPQPAGRVVLRGEFRDNNIFRRGGDIHSNNRGTGIYIGLAL